MLKLLHTYNWSDLHASFKQMKIKKITFFFISFFKCYYQVRQSSDWVKSSKVQLVDPIISEVEIGKVMQVLERLIFKK